MLTVQPKVGNKSGREKIQIIFRAGKSHTESARKFPHHPPCLEACADIDTDDYSTCLLFGFLFSQNHKNSNNQKQPSMTCVPVYLHGDHSNKNLVVRRFGLDVLFEVCESYFQPNFVSQNFSFSFQIKGSSLLCNELPQA